MHYRGVTRGHQDLPLAGEVLHLQRQGLGDVGLVGHGHGAVGAARAVVPLAEGAMQRANQLLVPLHGFWILTAQPSSGPQGLGLTL